MLEFSFARFPFSRNSFLPDIVFLPLSTRRSTMNFYLSLLAVHTGASTGSREFQITFTFPLCSFPSNQTVCSPRYRASNLSSSQVPADKRFLLYRLCCSLDFTNSFDDRCSQRLQKMSCAVYTLSTVFCSRRHA